MSLFLPQRWRRQPQYPVKVAPEYAPSAQSALIGGIPYDLVRQIGMPSTQPRVATSNLVTGVSGGDRTLYNTGDFYVLNHSGASVESIIPIGTDVTILGKFYKSAESQAGVAAMGTYGTTETHICNIYLPYTANGTTYWRWGGSSEGTSSLAVPSLSFATSDWWAFTSGPRGMEIWQNFRKVGSNSAGTSVSRSAGGTYFNLGYAVSGDGFVTLQIGQFVTLNRQLPEAILGSGNYWQLFAPLQRRIYFAPAAGGGDVAVNVSGVAATGNLGAPSVTGSANVAATGVNATGALGLPTLQWSANVAPSGVSAAGAVGSVSVTTTGNAVVNVAGVAATGNVGAPSVSSSANVAASGVNATGALGSVTVSTSANQNVNATGVSATGSLGTVALSISVNVPVTGVAATGNLGSPSIQAGNNVSVNVTGVAATGNVGSAVPIWDCTVTPAGIAAAGAMGSVSVQTGANISINVSGVSAVGNLGAMGYGIGINVAAPGVAATGAIGSPTVAAGTVVYAQGVAATGFVGAPGFSIGVQVPVVGVAAVGALGAPYLDQGGLLYTDPRFYAGNPKANRITDTP